MFDADAETEEVAEVGDVGLPLELLGSDGFAATGFSSKTPVVSRVGGWFADSGTDGLPSLVPGGVSVTGDGVCKLLSAGPILPVVAGLAPGVGGEDSAVAGDFGTIDAAGLLSDAGSVGGVVALLNGLLGGSAGTGTVVRTVADSAGLEESPGFVADFSAPGKEVGGLSVMIMGGGGGTVSVDAGCCDSAMVAAAEAVAAFERISGENGAVFSEAAASVSPCWPGSEAPVAALEASDRAGTTCGWDTDDVVD